MIKKDDSEILIGEDEWKIPVLECPFVRTGSGKEWLYCTECGRTILLNDNGKTYYHKKSCTYSNGIGYGDERENTTLPHSDTCKCFTCEPPKNKKGE